MSDSPIVREPPTRPVSSSPAVESSTTGGPSLLFRTGIVGTVALLVYYSIVADVEDPLHRYQGLAMIVLAVLPALQWARRQDTPFPIFPTFMITGLNSFALPLLGGHELLHTYPVESVSLAAWGVIVFQLAALIAYRLAPAMPRVTPWWTTPLFDHGVERYLRTGLALSTLYSGLAEFTPVIPYEINSVLRAVAYGVGTLCTFLLSRAWGTGELSLGDRVFFVSALILQVVFLTSTLFLVSGLSLLVLALVGYVSGARRVPLIACVLIFAVMAVLHSGKSPMRLKYWENQAPRPALSELPAFFAEWVSLGLKPPETPGAERLVTRRLIERTSLLHMLTLVVDATPSRQPFLEGETYLHILPQLVPRFFWPEKPLGHVSTHRLAIYYGLQDEEGTLKTTIGFGVVVEAYANFGFTGLILLGLLIGGLSRVVTVWTRHSPLISYPGLIMVLLMAWSFQIELPLSAWLASLYQAALAVLGLPFLVKTLLH